MNIGDGGAPKRNPHLTMRTVLITSLATAVVTVVATRLVTASFDSEPDWFTYAKYAGLAMILAPVYLLFFTGVFGGIHYLKQLICRLLHKTEKD